MYLLIFAIATFIQHPIFGHFEDKTSGRPLLSPTATDFYILNLVIATAFYILCYVLSQWSVEEYEPRQNIELRDSSGVHTYQFNF